MHTRKIHTNMGWLWILEQYRSVGCVQSELVKIPNQISILTFIWRFFRIRSQFFTHFMRIALKILNLFFCQTICDSIATDGKFRNYLNNDRNFRIDSVLSRVFHSIVRTKILKLSFSFVAIFVTSFFFFFVIFFHWFYFYFMHLFVEFLLVIAANANAAAGVDFVAASCRE